MLLKNLCETIIDNRGKTPLLSEYGYALIEAQCFSNQNFVKSEDAIKYITKSTFENMRSGTCKENDIVVTLVGNIGHCALILEPVAIAQNIVALRIDTRVANPLYVFYYMKTNYFKKNCEQLNRSSVQPSINVNDFLNIEIDLPDRKTQDKIAEILSGIDEQINRNNEVVKKLQVLGNTIYSNVFKNCSATCSLVDFPHIKLIKQGINEFAGKKHYIATADVTNDNLDFDAQKITFDNREGRANMQPVKNSVWFAQMKNSIKHIFISNNDDYLVDNYIFSTGFYGFECDEIAYEFMIGTLSLPYFEQIKDKMANGAIMASINSDSLNLIKIPMPTEEQLSSYHEKTRYIYMQISAIKTENYKLSKLKERLLPLLINGQLSI